MNKRPLLIFGPGIVLAAIVAGALLWPRIASAPMGRSPGNVAPLWKPQPSDLLDGRIQLTASQRKQIETVARRWQTYRATTERRLADYQEVVDLEAFSQLSREYDATRTRLWLQATGLLDAAQRRKVENRRLEARR